MVPNTHRLRRSSEWENVSRHCRRLFQMAGNHRNDVDYEYDNDQRINSSVRPIRQSRNYRIGQWKSIRFKIIRRILQFKRHSPRPIASLPYSVKRTSRAICGHLQKSPAKAQGRRHNVKCAPEVSTSVPQNTKFSVAGWTIPS